VAREKKYECQLFRTDRNTHTYKIKYIAFRPQRTVECCLDTTWLCFQLHVLAALSIVPTGESGLDVIIIIIIITIIIITTTTTTKHFGCSRKVSTIISNVFCLSVGLHTHTSGREFLSFFPFISLRTGGAVAGDTAAVI
jgi:hypothetical protein